jgi:DNA-binding transcriptional MerR regulator/methylmalonyl-CoA mutase cobalamin-binding subunit
LSTYFIDVACGIVQFFRVAEMEPERGSEAGTTYSLGAVSRLTGLSPHVLRAWERRYQAVLPLRTPGGTRRYRESDVTRLRLLAAATAAGHPIGDIARLSEAELRGRASGPDEEPRPPLRRILEAIERLDADETERLLSLQLAALGARGFVEAVARPLLHEVGEQWEKGELCVASEHLASASVRNLLGLALRRRSQASDFRPVLFTTLAGERHELGALACAVIAVELGANAIYLGPDLPAGEVAAAAAATCARVVAVSTGRCAPARQREQAVRTLRRELPSDVAIWLGGSGSDGLPIPEHVERVQGREELEQKLVLRSHRR